MSINRTKASYLIILSGVIFFSIRWYQSFLIFDENIDVKIIFDGITDAYKYFPIFKSFTELNLSNSYDIEITNLNNLTVPFGSFYLHYILYLLIKSWAFIVLELACIVMFLVIFYKISRLLDFKREVSLLISVFLYNLPLFLDLTSLSSFSYISVISFDFYTLRFPRPLITNLFLYYFMLIILTTLNKGELIKRKKFILLGIVFSLSLTSFIYHFLLIQITFLFALIYLYKTRFKSYLYKNYVSFILLILTFSIFSLPLILNYNFSEKEFLERMGALDLDFEKRKILINYIFKKFLDVKFIIIIIISGGLTYLINCRKYKKEFSKNNLFLFMFYSSILSPIVFIFFSPNFFSHFYFFNNLTVISFFLLIFFVFSKLIQINLIRKISSKTFNVLVTTIIISVFFTNFIGMRNNYNFNKTSIDDYNLRIEFNDIVDLIQSDKIDLKNSSLLTFDNKIMVWSILNEIRYLKIINGVFVSKKNEMIENDLVKTFKFLNLEKDDLKNFIMNKKKGWRYRNDNVMNLFWHRYQANSLTTFNDSKDFDKEILMFINNSSPIMPQHLIIPNYEIDRLVQKFDNNIEFNSDPDIIIINKKDPILSKSFIDPKKFCKTFDGAFYIFYQVIKNEKCN